MNKLVKIFFYALISYLLIIPLRGGYITLFGITGLSLSTLVGVLLVPLTVFFLQKYGKDIAPWKILIAIILGVAILETPLRIFRFSTTLISLPDFTTKILAPLLGFLYYQANRKFCKILLVVCTILLYVWISCWGTDLWLHKLNFGTFTGKTEQIVDNQIIFTNTKGEPVGVHDFKGKYLVLDFWSSSCGVCFMEFPVVQAIYDKYKDSRNIALYSIHCRIERTGETFATGSGILLKNDYTFPNLSISIDNPMLKDIGVDGFPTVIIFNPEGKLIFRGSIESASSYINELIN